MTVRPGGGVDNRYDREYANMDAGDHNLGGRKHRTLNQQPDERTDRIFVNSLGDSEVVKNDAS